MGKLPTEDLKKLLSCIKMDPRVIVPPQPGFDSGVHLMDGDKYLVVSTDPCTGVPEEWFGWFLIHYVASDIALFGAKMEFCTINLLGPPATKPTIFHRIMRQACNAANELDAAIVTGHTGTYEGISDLVGTCTVYGFTERDKIITPAGAKPGDYLLCSKPIGLETVINFALTRKASAKKLFGPEQTRNLANQIKMQTCVQEALILAKTGSVSAMHDATEGGLVAALNEIASASNVGFQLNYTDLPVPPELTALAKRFSLSETQVLSTSSTGTLLAAVSPSHKNKIICTLSNLGFDAKIIGAVTKSRQRLINYDGKEEKFPRTARDPYAKLLQKE